MSGKLRSPYALSEIALLVICLAVSNRTAYAADSEAPAVLNFARKYQQQIQPPHFNPPAEHKVVKKAAPAPQHTRHPTTNNQQVKQLQSDVAEKQRILLQKDADIQALKQQVASLRHAAAEQSTTTEPVPLAQQDVQALHDLAKSLRNVFSLSPGNKALQDKVKQANQAANRARLAETTLQEKQKVLNQQLQKLHSQLETVQSKKVQDNTVTVVNETALKQQIKKLNDANTQLASELAASHDTAQKKADQLKGMESEIQHLMARGETERQQYAREKQQLQHQLELAAAPKSEQLTESQQRITALEAQLAAAPKSEQLTESQQKITALEAQLAAAPKSEQLTESQQKITALEAQLAAAPKSGQLTESQQKITALEAQLAAAPKSGQLTESQQKITALEAQLAAAPKSGQLTESQQKITALEAQLAAAPKSEQLTESQLKIKALQTQLDAALLLKKDTLIDQTKVDSIALQAEKKSSEEKLKALQAKLDTALLQQAALEKQKTIKPAADITPDKLKEKTIREAYAIGVSLGDEILQLQAENRDWAATDSDKPSVLAGIIDAFQGKTKLSPDVLRSTLTEVSQQVKNGRHKLLTALDESTKKFLARFTKDKKVHKSDNGFWYRINYEGDESIPKNATLDLVVKESLTNGVVVEDMDAKGIVLTQPISAFPPVFGEALSKLKNHGSITIVVPPELAYGDKGYPPKVPPNATMVYDLRIAEVYPEDNHKNNLSNKSQ